MNEKWLVVLAGPYPDLDGMAGRLAAELGCAALSHDLRPLGEPAQSALDMYQPAANVDVSQNRTQYYEMAGNLLGLIDDVQIVVLAGGFELNGDTRHVQDLTGHAHRRLLVVWVGPRMVDLTADALTFFRERQESDYRALHDQRVAVHVVSVADSEATYDAVRVAVGRAIIVALS